MKLRATARSIRFLSNFTLGSRKFVARKSALTGRPGAQRGTGVPDQWRIDRREQMTARSWREAWVRLTKRGWAMRYRRSKRASAASIIILCSFVTTNWVTPAWTPPDIYLSRALSAREPIARDRYPSASTLSGINLRQSWRNRPRVGLDRSFSPRSNVKNGTT